jgi:hypothetical protein
MTVQSRKTLLTILQTNESQNSETDDRMRSTEKMTNNAGDDGSTLLAPQAKTSGKRYITQQYVDFYVPIGFMNFTSTSL